MRGHQRPGGNQSGHARHGLRGRGTPLTNTLQWANGDSSPRTLLVPVCHDGRVTGPQTVKLVLFNASTNGAIGNRGTSVLQINDDDAYGNLAFNSSVYYADKNGGSITILVVRTNGTTGTVAVNCSTAGGSATAGRDYVAVNTNLVFGDGEIAKSFNVGIIDNSSSGGDLTVNLVLNGTNITAPSTALLTIVDNQSSALPAGSLDSTFNLDSAVGADHDVYALEVQPDGKLLMAGDFTRVNNVTRNGIARLTADATLDGFFNAGLGPNGPIRTMALQPDGRIMVGGFFTSVNGTNRNHLARLSIDGSMDASFNPGSGLDGAALALALQSDGRVLAGGSFVSYNGVAQPHLARVNANGTLDTTFNVGTGPNDVVYAIAVQQDGKILVGGDFTAVNDNTNFLRIARLYPNGTLDASFSVGLGPDGPVRAICVLPDGSIVLGGSFTNVNGLPRHGLARLNPNGSLNMSYLNGLVSGTTDVGADDAVYALAVQLDGKLIVGGNFTHFNGVNRNRITRLNDDGSTDPTINFGSGANGYITALKLQPDRKILIGGGFTMVQGVPRNRVARLFGGSLAGSGVVEFGAGLISVPEAVGSAVVEVWRRGGLQGSVGVQAGTTDGSAINGVDYLGLTNWLVFPQGETLQTFLVPVLNNTRIENTKTVLLSLFQPTNGVALGAQPSAELDILNDDSRVDFASSSFTVMENVQNGFATITLVRTGATNTTVTVSCQTVANTNLPNPAAAGTNFLPVSGSVTFQPGQVSNVFQVPILNDGIPAGNKNAQLLLTGAAPANSVSLGLASAVLTILDAQPAPGVLSFSQAAYQVSELGTNAVITIVRNNGASGLVSVRCNTSDGTGVAGLDYVGVTNVVAFADGEISKVVLVPIIHDPQKSNNTTVNLSLSQASGGATLVAPATAVLTILDVESRPPPPVYLSFASTNYGVTESSSLAVITVIRSNNVAGRVTVDFATVDGTANDTLDYLGTNGTLVFAPNETAQTFTVPIIFDQLGEPTETVVLTLSNPSGSAVINTGYALLYITNTALAGSVDDTFNARWGADGPVYAAVFDASENLYVGGSFQYLNGLAVNSVGRMTTNGAVDPAFNPGLGPNGPVYALGRSTNGLVLGGAFTNVNTVGRGRVARLKFDGRVDPAFNSVVGTDGDVLAVAVQLDDRVVVGGSFQSVGGQSFNNIGRFNQDGTVDGNFLVGGGANGTVRAVALMAYGLSGSPILIGGDFTRLNGVRRNY
ncbi:MAG: hypothetical protein NTW03_15510 [Verrucomicrobia bacterium]|nr:hypothetical protein [Verrucomicrobiota bacterium]